MEVSLILSSIITAVCLTFAIKFIYAKFRMSRLCNIPCMFDIPYLNFVFSVIRLRFIGSREKRIKLFDDYCYRFDKYFKLWFGPRLSVCVTGPDEVKKVLTSQICSEKFIKFYGILEGRYSILGGSVLDGWSKGRKFTSLSFTPKCLDTMRPKFDTAANKIHEKIEKLIEKVDEFDIDKLVTPVFLEMFSELFLGVDENDYKDFAKLLDAFEL